MESNGILDSQISASSNWNNGHRAANGRLNFQAGSGRTGAWSAKSNDVHQWLQVDFLKRVRIDKVATQGRPDHAQWVTSYRLSYSQDGIIWNELPVSTLLKTFRAHVLLIFPLSYSYFLLCRYMLEIEIKTQW